MNEPHSRPADDRGAVEVEAAVVGNDAGSMPLQGHALPKTPTGIAGFDALAFGGLPEGRATLIAGASGSGKTVFALQFLHEGVFGDGDGEPGVFVTFEESPEDIRRNMLGFGWDIADWEDRDRFAFVDAAPPEQAEHIVGRFDLDGLLGRILHTCRRIGANRIALDSLSQLYGQGFGSRGRDGGDAIDHHGELRRELYRLVRALRKEGLTVLLTVERAEPEAGVGRYVDEFVVDAVVVLRNVLKDERRRRTMEITKYRGSRHREGEAPFTIDSGNGIVSVPLSSLRLTQNSSNERVGSGIDALDSLCGGGFFRDSIILASGPTGTGKTLLATQFIGHPGAGGGHGDPGDVDGRSLLMGYEESREQLFRNAATFGVDLQKLEDEQRLKVVCQYPEVKDLQAHLIEITEIIEEFKPTRIAIDSLSALERIGSVAHFREFLIGLTSLVKRHEVCTLVTSTSRDLIGAKSVSEQHISTLTDSIILLRYVEVETGIERGLVVLKMRGSDHDTEIRRFEIDKDGFHIKEPFDGMAGIMLGDSRGSTPSRRSAGQQ